MVTPVYPILELPLLEDHQSFVIKVLYSRGDLHLPSTKKFRSFPSNSCNRN